MTTILRRRGLPPSGRGEGGPLRTAGTAGRRRSLPSGRAVAGAFLIAVAATIVVTAWLASVGEHGKTWVVAAHFRAAGTQLSASDLRTETMTLSDDSATQAFATPAALIGRTLAAPLDPGELVERAMLVPLGHQPPLRPVTISVTAADTSGLVAGGLVDVLETSGNGATARTSVVLRGARVLGVTGGSTSVINSSGTEVSLGVASLSEVEAIVHAEQTATVSVVVGEPSDGAGLGPGTGS